MCVIPASAGGLRGKTVRQLSMRGNHGRAFFHRAVVDGIYLQPVPMHQLWSIRLVSDLYVDRYVLFQSKQRSWDLPVVTNSCNANLRCEFKRELLNTQGVIGLFAASYKGKR